MPAPSSSRHRAAAIEIRRIFQPDLDRQVQALLVILERPAPVAAEQDDPPEAAQCGT